MSHRLPIGVEMSAQSGLPTLPLPTAESLSSAHPHGGSQAGKEGSGDTGDSHQGADLAQLPAQGVLQPAVRFIGPAEVSLQGISSGIGRAKEMQLDAYIRLLTMALRHRQGERRQAERQAASMVFSVVRTVSLDAVTHIFGSHITQLATPASDVDVAIELPQRRHFSLVAKALRQQRWVRDLKEIASAQVPVIKLEVDLGAPSSPGAAGRQQAALASPEDASPPTGGAVATSDSGVPDQVTAASPMGGSAPAAARHRIVSIDVTLASSAHRGLATTQ